MCSAVTGAGTARAVVHPFRATQGSRRHARGARGILRAGLSGPITRFPARLSPPALPATRSSRSATGSCARLGSPPRRSPPAAPHSDASSPPSKAKDDSPASPPWHPNGPRAAVRLGSPRLSQHFLSASSRWSRRPVTAAVAASASCMSSDINVTVATVRRHRSSQDATVSCPANVCARFDGRSEPRAAARRGQAGPAAGRVFRDADSGGAEAAPPSSMRALSLSDRLTPPSVRAPRAPSLRADRLRPLQGG